MAGASMVCPCGAPLTPRPRPPAVTEPTAPLAQAELVTCTTCQRVLVAGDPNVGRVLLGKWRLERRLGQGGMGTVYLATDLTVERKVALKFLHAKLADQPEYRSRFEREAKVMAKVEHPNLAKLFGVDRLGTTPFLVMKFVPGTVLSRVMKERPKLQMPEVVGLVKQIGAALSRCTTPATCTAT